MSIFRPLVQTAGARKALRAAATGAWRVDLENGPTSGGGRTGPKKADDRIGRDSNGFAEEELVRRGVAFGDDDGAECQE